MIHAYDRNYLENTRRKMGVMLDFAVNALECDLAAFYKKFLISEISEKIEHGDSKISAGKSGIELCYEIIDPMDKIGRNDREWFCIEKNNIYWTGWALSFFQWQTSLRFAQIDRYISIEEVGGLYEPYHEMDILQFSDKMLELYQERKQNTNLKLMRTALGLSQSQLADMSGIPVRTIQQYEQRQKNINRASFEYIVSLAGTLNCETKDLLEIEV